jgi:hypothetical protein
MMSEVWKDIPGYPTYQVSESGNIRRIRDGRVKMLKSQITPKGYARITLNKANSKPRHKKVHRLVALTFLGEPLDDTRNHVNHKDGVKLNNHHSNLEWVSNRENITHAIENNLLTHNLKVRVYDTVTGDLQIIPSMETTAGRFNIGIMTLKRYLGRYPDLKFMDRYLFEPLLEELTPTHYPRSKPIIAFDYVSCKRIVANNLGVMTLLTGVATTTIETHVTKGFNRLLGGYVFKYLHDTTPFPEHTVDEAKASRERYLSRKPRVVKSVTLEEQVTSALNEVTLRHAA